MSGDRLALGAVAALAVADVVRRRGSAARFIEADSDLFMESGCNVTCPAKVEKYVEIMETHGGWGPFPPIHGVFLQVTEDDLEEYTEAEQEGYAHELAWSRPPVREDLGRTYVAIEDGHHRSHAASRVGVPIRVKVWS